ncbi:glycine oxidase ThiO [Rhodoferax ferrireducens]|uniref:glycine oxidase ThiO n=1 Tax=Rhodoferax ferrireducens TaxID=192843 RepID=UPI0038670A7C
MDANLAKPLSTTILGAGLMGRLLALALARAGHAVQVFEAGGPDAEGAAARVAAAMLAPLAESAITEPQVVQMGQYSLQRWPQLIAQLDAPVFFQQNGTLILWHRQDAAEATRFGHQLSATRQQLPSLPAPQALDAAGIAALEPAIANRFAQGLYLPGEGQLDNRQLLAALLLQLQKHQVGLHWHSPRQPEDCQADWVIDCRGLGAQAQWPSLRAVRGEVLRLHAPDVALQRPVRLVHPRYPLYIAPKPGNLFVVGATEIESDDMSPMSVRSSLELLSAAYSVHPGFGEARILESATQCRPTLPNNLPAIRRPSPRVLQINGLYRHGFLIAPAMLDAVLELMEKEHSALATQWELAIETV